MRVKIENPLYDPALLEKSYLGERYASLVEDGTLCVRPLCSSDYRRGYLDLLKQLTEVGNISQQQFEGIFIQS